jgi:hypothetical protein
LWPDIQDVGPNNPEEYNRSVITDPPRFQDHRHRPLGHLSCLRKRTSMHGLAGHAPQRRDGGCGAKALARTRWKQE